MDQISRKRIIWTAIFSSTFIFIFAAFILKINSQSNNTLSLGPIVTYIIFGIGLVLLATSHFLPKITQAQNIEKTNNIEPIFLISLAINEMGSFIAYFLKVFFNNSEASLAMFAATIIVFIAKFPMKNENE